MTRSLIIFRNSEGVILFIYVDHDGYPAGIGRHLARILGAPSQGFACLAAQAAALLLVDCWSDEVDELDSDDEELPSARFNTVLPCGNEQMLEEVRANVQYIFTVYEREGRPMINLSESPFTGTEDRELSPSIFLQEYPQLDIGTVQEVPEASAAMLWEDQLNGLESLGALDLPEAMNAADPDVSLALRLVYVQEDGVSEDDIFVLRLDGGGWADYLAGTPQLQVVCPAHDHQRRLSVPTRRSTRSPSDTSTIRVSRGRSGPSRPHFKRHP